MKILKRKIVDFWVPESETGVGNQIVQPYTFTIEIYQDLMDIDPEASSLKEFELGNSKSTRKNTKTFKIHCFCSDLRITRFAIYQPRILQGCDLGVLLRPRENIVSFEWTQANLDDFHSHHSPKGGFLF